MDNYDQQRAEADALAAAEAQVTPALSTPAPVPFAADRAKVEAYLRGGMPPELAAQWDAGALHYQLSGFDSPDGWGWVLVLDRAGQEVGGARCHWSVIAAAS